MSTWMSIEIFNADYGTQSWVAAQVWAESHTDTLIEAAVTHGAIDWHRNKTAWGIVIEIEFESDKHWQCFRNSTNMRDILDRAPDPRNGVLVYKGRSLDGGSTAKRPKKPKSGSGGASLGLPFASRPFVEPLPALFSDTNVDTRRLTRSR